jgi:hypothetical protein
VSVLFETHLWAFATPGGGERQVIQYAKHLASHDVDVVLHDHWNPVLETMDAVHFFRASPVRCIFANL